jgi:hypothetical protein
MLAYWFFKRQRKAYELWAQQEGVRHSCTAEEEIEATLQVSNCKKKRGKKDGIPSKKQNLTKSSKRKRRGNDTDTHATSDKRKKRRDRSSRWLRQRATHMFMLQASGWVSCDNEFDGYGRKYSGRTQQAWCFYSANEQQEPGF